MKERTYPWKLLVQLVAAAGLELEALSGRDPERAQCVEAGARCRNPERARKASRRTSPTGILQKGILVAAAGLELEELSGRGRSGSPLPKS